MGLEDLPELCYPEMNQKSLIPVFEKAEISFQKRGITLAYVIGKTRGIIYLASDGVIIDGRVYAERFEFADISTILEYKKL